MLKRTDQADQDDQDGQSSLRGERWREGSQGGGGQASQTMSWKLSDIALGERKGARQRGPLRRRPQRE